MILFCRNSKKAAVTLKSFIKIKYSSHVFLRNVYSRINLKFAAKYFKKCPWNVLRYAGRYWYISSLQWLLFVCFFYWFYTILSVAFIFNLQLYTKLVLTTTSTHLASLNHLKYAMKFNCIYFNLIVRSINSFNSHRRSRSFYSCLLVDFAL